MPLIDESSMKTIEQVSRYLSSCIFDDDSWEQVLSFCREHFGGGKAHRPRRGQYHTTFPDFSMWFYHQPGQGDIVRIGNLIGIVGKCTPSVFSICAYIGQNKRLIQNDLVVFPHRVALADSDEAKAFREKMFQAQISYSVTLGMLTKIYIPEDGDFVVVKHHNSLRNGIFMSVKHSEYFFYFLDNQDERVEPVVIPCSECELTGATSKESLEMLERLSHLGFTWSAKDKQLTPVPLKAKLGGKYWYINDKFYVCQAKDMQTPTHKERYKSGNYFTNYAEALVFLKRLKELRMKINKGLDQ